MPRDWQMTERGDGLGPWIEELRQIEASGGDLKDRLDHATDHATELLRASMPVRTGRLKASGSWSSQMAGDVYSAEISFGGELAPYAPYVVGRGVDGEHPWDAAWLAGQALYAEVLAEEFPGIPGGAL